MTDNIQHIDVDSDEFIEAPRALREHVKKLQSALTEREQDVSSLKGQLTSTALSDVLKGYRNPERVKQHLLGDKVDALDSEAVNKWLAENGDDYAKAEGAQPETPGGQPNEPQVDPAEAAAHQQIAGASDYSKPADLSALDAALAELPKDATGSDIVEVYRKHGV